MDMLKNSYFAKYLRCLAVLTEFFCRLAMNGSRLLFLGFSITVFGQTNEDPIAIGSKELPPQAYAQLQQQTKAMALIYLEYNYSWQPVSGNGASNVTGYSEYFEGNKFNQLQMLPMGHGTGHHDHEYVFDGVNLYMGFRDEPGIDLYRNVLTKFSSVDKTDPFRLRRYLNFSYLDAAGFYTPATLADLENFNSVSSMVLRYLNESDSTRIETAADGLLKVTVRVTDQFLANLRKLDVKQAAALGALPPEANGALEAEVNKIKELQQAEPKRTLVFLLDPKVGYGVVKREEFTPSGEMILQIKSEEWKYYKDIQIWMPDRSSIIYYLNPLSQAKLLPNAPKYATNDLVSIEFSDTHKKPFSVDYTMAGALIVDRTSPEARSSHVHQVSFRRAASGVELRQVAERLNPTRRRVIWGVLGCLTLLPLFGTWLFYKKSRR